jgi:hypothetical protein
VDDYWERGLIGVTLHPDFPRTPHLFVLYVAKQPFTRQFSADSRLIGDQADPRSEMVLLEGDDQKLFGGTQPGGHQGGPIRFGPDGKLYVALGEQTAGKPSQSLQALQGKFFDSILTAAFHWTIHFTHKQLENIAPSGLWAFAIRSVSPFNRPRALIRNRRRPILLGGSERDCSRRKLRLARSRRYLDEYQFSKSHFHVSTRHRSKHCGCSVQPGEMADAMARPVLLC